MIERRHSTKVLVGILSLTGMLLAPFVAHAAPPGVAATDGVWVLAGQRVLFTYVGDATPEKSTCIGDCAKVWSPLLAEADAVAGAGWTIAQQADGRRVWAYEGKPVYTLINPDRNGYKSESALWLRAHATPWYPPGVTIGRFDLLAKADGGELRHIRNSTCDDYCKTYWRPLAAPIDAVDVQDWSVVEGPDGARVWATQERVVYEQRPGTTLPPLTEGKLVFSSMVGILPTKVPRSTRPITMTPDARDVHDWQVTKPPKPAPGLKTPEYPADSLRAGERDLVSIQFCVGADGTVTRDTLSIPSKYARLNEATLAWAPTIKFIPGEVNGAPAETCGYTLELEWTHN